jgi:hypothetical protein
VLDKELLMTEDRQDQDYLGLFKPKSETPTGSAAEAAGSDSEGLPASPPEPTDETGATVPAESVDDGESTSQQVASDAPDSPAESFDQRPLVSEPGSEPGSRQAEDLVYETTEDAWFAPQASEPIEPPLTFQTLGVAVGAGCLLLMLTAVVVFAFVQVFVRGQEDEVLDTPTPTMLVAVTPLPTDEAAEAPLAVAVPVVSSADVLVPVTLPQRLIIGDAVFAVQAVVVPAGSWPDIPTSGNTATWAYGTVVNYVLVLAPTAENLDLVSRLQRGDPLSLDSSSGVVLNFNVSRVTVGAAAEAAYFEQASPQLTVAVLTDDPTQRKVVTATYFDDEARDQDELSTAAIGLVGTLVNQGPVRVTVLETYQVTGAAAGLPAGAGYLLMDVTVENVGTEALEPGFFQTYVSDPSGNRFPLTFLAEQFAHYGFPTDVLAPGETVIGSLGYLVTPNVEGEYRWVFNPQPGSEHWVIVPIPYETPPIPSTEEPPPMAGFVIVNVNTSDVFVNKDDDLLDVVLRIENTSAGVVSITEDDVSLNSFSDGQLTLVAPAPPLPWTIEPGEFKLFQLQFELPTAGSALLTVYGYTFSIENLGGQ